MKVLSSFLGLRSVGFSLLHDDEECEDDRKIVEAILEYISRGLGVAGTAII